MRLALAYEYRTIPTSQVATMDKSANHKPSNSKNQKPKNISCRVRGIIVENTFTSVGDMAAELFPMLRVLRPLFPLFLKSKWKSQELVRIPP